MKKLFWASGAITLVFGLLFIFGVLDLQNTVGRAFAAGNRQYAAEAFDTALTAYETGLQNEPENQLLDYNAALASYQLQSWDKAVAFFSKAPASVDRYLHQGNAFFRLGEEAADLNGKLQHYTNALKIYREGILAFPQSVELKFNYEFVLEKIKEQQENQENQNNQEQNQQENQEGNGQDQQQDSQQGPGEGQQGDRESSQEGQQNNDNEQQDNKQSDKNEGKLPEEQNEQGSENTESQEDPQSQENQEQGHQQNQENNSQDQQQQTPEQQAQQALEDEESNEQDPAGGSVQELSEVERILQMLEKQEEEALKNNQQIRGSGEEDEHDW